MGCDCISIGPYLRNTNIIHEFALRLQKMDELTDAHVDEFKSNGFTKIDGFWSSLEFGIIEDALEAVFYKGKLKNVATENDGETHTLEDRNLQLCPLMPEHRVFDCLPFVSKVGKAISKLILEHENENVNCYLSQTVWRPPWNGLGTGWHQDNAYFKFSNGRKGIAMWTAVHESTLYDTLHLIPKMDSEVLPHVRDLSSDQHITCKDSVNEEYSVPLTVLAGDVVFFNCNVPNSTELNISNRPRAAVVYHFVSSEVYKERQFSIPEGAEYSTPIIWGPESDMKWSLTNKKNGMTTVSYSNVVVVKYFPDSNILIA